MEQERSDGWLQGRLEEPYDSGRCSKELERDLKWLETKFDEVSSSASGGRRLTGDVPAEDVVATGVNAGRFERIYGDDIPQQDAYASEALQASLYDRAPRTDEEELRHLVDLRKCIAESIKASEDYLRSLKEAFLRFQAAEGDLARLKEYLHRLDEYHDYDQRGTMMPIHAECVRLPLFPQMEKDVPLMAKEAGEIQDLRLHSSKTPWPPADSARLRKVVSNECQRLLIIDQYERGRGEPAGSTAPPDDTDHVEQKLDWLRIARNLGHIRTAEDCRTHWLMTQRPGLQDGEWTGEELEKLKAIIARHTSEGKAIVDDWTDVASEMKNGRSAIDCFCACQQNGMLSEVDGQSWQSTPLAPQEAEELQRLQTIWGERTAIIEERLGTLRPKSMLAPVRDTHEAVHWSGRADEALLRHLSNKYRKRRSTLLRQTHLAEQIDWSEQYTGRPQRASDDEVSARWRWILDDFPENSAKYLRPSRAAR